MRLLKVMVPAVCIWVLAMNCLAQNEKFSPSKKFYAAAYYYKEGHYKEAIAAYEEILNNGFESGALYYNLGNSYFKDDQLGKAIVNYERADGLIPRDGDLKSNYDFALSRIKDDTQRHKPFFWRVMETYNGRLTLDEMVLFLCGLYVLLAATFLLKLFLARPLKSITAVMILGGICFLLNSLAFVIKIKNHENAAIVIQATEAQFEPTPKATAYFALPEGQKVKILEKEVDYLKVKRPDGKIGWVPEVAVERI